MAPPAVIVIDTNFCSRGKYQSKRLGAIFQRLVARGHRVVVPEVVVWEWAEHLHRAMKATADAASIVARDVAASGLGFAIKKLATPTTQEICAAIVNDLGSMEGVQVRSPFGPDAVAAIKDQVLQQGLGTVKSGIKTGAADSLVLAVAVNEADDPFSDSPVLLCTNDELLARAAAESDPSPTVIRDLTSLWRWHGTTQPADHDLANAVGRALLGDHDPASGTALQRLPISLLTGRWDHQRLRAAADLPPRNDHYDLHVAVDHLRHAVVSNLEVVDGEELPHLVLARATIAGDVVLDDWYFDADGRLAHEQGTAVAQISAQVIAEFNESWSIGDVDVLDVARVTAMDDEERWPADGVPGTAEGRIA